MKSPFPGMDPYLESHWGDVHNSLMTYARNQLQGQLPKDLRARVEEQITVEDEAEDFRQQRWKPDVRVVEQPNSKGTTKTANDEVAVEAHLVLEWDEEPAIYRSIHIVDTRHGNRLVTAIEFLSPANKVDPVGRKMYWRKQRELRAGSVSLVEIDLLRVGKYVLAAPLAGLPSEYLEPYLICVSRGWETGKAELYRASIRLPLPLVRIPLRESDQDAILNLQALIDAAYTDAGYDDIDYSEDADPPLTGDDAEWADQLLRRQGRR